MDFAAVLGAELTQSQSVSTICIEKRLFANAHLKAAIVLLRYGTLDGFSRRVAAQKRGNQGFQ